MRSSLDTSGIDTSRHKAERDFRDNPPEFEPGQGTGDGWNMDFDNFGSGSSNSGGDFGDPFAGLGGIGSGTQDSSFSGSGNNTSLSNILNPSMNQGAQQQQQQQSQKIEDKVWDLSVSAAKTGFKGAKGFIEECKEAFEDNSEIDLQSWAFSMAKGSLVMGGFGLALFLLSLILPNLSKDYSLSLIISALLTFAGSEVFFMFRRDSLKKAAEAGVDVGRNFDDGDEYDDSIEESPEEGGTDWSSNWEDDGQGDDSESDSDFDFGNWGDDEEEEDDKPAVEVVKSESVDDALKDLDNSYIPVNMATRAYLVETFLKVLPSFTPDFSRMDEIPEDSDDFNNYDAYIYEICNRIGLPEEKIPKLISLKENLFIVQLKLDRPKGFNKEQVLADELAQVYKVDQEMGRPKFGLENTYATYTTSGLNFFINLYVCEEPPMISLGDIYRKDRARIENTKLKMPLIWGVTELGDVIWCDADNIDTAIVSGIPRSGKSWKMQSILLQLCMFNSPEDVNFYLLDPKDTNSDYYNIRNSCPHFKCFRSTKETILHELERITTVERDKRSNLFKEKGVINIKDMHRRFPGERVPYLYIILDEMFTLVNSMDKDELNHLWELLGYIVTKMPNLGFRLICVPHRIVNENIKKTLSNNIPNKVAIKATKSDIVTGLDVKEKDLTFSLPNKGDMALKSSEVNGGEILYVHGEVITDSNEGNEELFRYVGEVWRRLVPDYDEGKKDKEVAKKENKRVNHDFVSDSTDDGENAVDLLSEYEEEPVEDAISVDDMLEDNEDNGISDLGDNEDSDNSVLGDYEGNGGSDLGNDFSDFGSNWNDDDEDDEEKPDDDSLDDWGDLPEVEESFWK